MLSLSQKVIIAAERQLASLVSRQWPVCQICVPTARISAVKVLSPYNKSFHSSAVALADFDPERRPAGVYKEKKRWTRYNDIVYPPQKPGEPRRPAEVCHHRSNIQYQKYKMWYLAGMIRGLTIDEAMKRLSFSAHKGSHIILEVLKEAQDMAVQHHNVEFKSNLWIESSFVTRAAYGRTFGGKQRWYRVSYCHYFVRLSEGKPPEQYYPNEKTGYEKMEEYIRGQRARRVTWSL